jgi:hypothetical protein
VAFLLALILKEIPLRTAARLDAAQALTGHPAPARSASARHSHHHPGTPRQPTRSDRKPRLRPVPAAGLTRPRASRLPARTCPNNPPAG